MRSLRVNRTLAALAAGLAIGGPAAAQTSAIAVDALPQLDAWASGALGPTNGGLAPSLWQGSDPGALAILFDEGPRAYGSPAAAALAARALQSSSRSPGGGAAAQDAVRKRYGALGRLGAADALAAMVTGQAAADATILQFGVQAELARGADEAACGKAEGLLAGETPPPFGFRMRAFCLARDGDAAGAELALEIGRQSNAADPFVTAAIDTMLGRARTPPAGRFDTSFNAALSIAAKLKPGPNALNGSSSLALVRIARDAAAPPSLRYGAAVMALRYGLIDPTTAKTAIRASLEAPPPAPAQKGAKPAPAPVQPLALALKTVETAAAGPDRARALATAVRRADTPGAALTVARLFRADMGQIAPAVDLADVAAAFAKAALLTGDSARAASWRAVAPQETTAALDAALAAAGQADLASAIDRRIAAIGASAPAAARDVRLLAAIGAPCSDTAAAFAAANAPPAPTPADPAKLAALAAAQAKGALGETALRAANLAADGAHRLDPAALAAIIQALRAVGLEGDARALGVEALAANLPA